MFLTSTSAFRRWEKAAWPIVRPFVPRRTRWFIEGHPKLDGQLWRADRQLLYEAVRARAPRRCYEIGTWKGGGSTLFIAQALHDNGGGVLHTIEVDAALARWARDHYQAHLPQLAACIEFHVGDYRREYRASLAGGDDPAEAGSHSEEEAAARADFVFLDGAEDGADTLAQYEFFLPHLGPGSVVVLHDWFTEKARLVRRVLEASREWRVETVLAPPRSVGCALAVRTSTSAT